MSGLKQERVLPVPPCPKCGGWLAFDPVARKMRCAYAGCNGDAELPPGQFPYVRETVALLGTNDTYAGPHAELFEHRTSFYAYALSFFAQCAALGAKGPCLDVGGYNGVHKVFFEGSFEVTDTHQGDPVLDDGAVHRGDRSYATVICTQTMEHLRNPIATFKELCRISSKHVIFTVPAIFGYHPDPEDCWRVMPDGVNYLVRMNPEFKAVACNFISYGETWLDVQLFLERK